MLLNKYGGRTFNDINQYPIFPWVIQDYISAELDLSTCKSYRSLKYSIGAITPEKRRAADEKLSNLLAYNTVIRPFQFGTHYLPGRVALGYLVRIEPYASLIQHYDQNKELSNRIFHSLRTAWNGSMNDVSDNKELIPEFYYLPEMFGNYNMYWFGFKAPEDSLNQYVNSKKSRVIVDQNVFPRWASNGHDFVRMNVLALESGHTSQLIHAWFDLIFGCKQQDQKAYNLFKECCDEESIAKQRNRLDAYPPAEIQEFGTNPIKLFYEHHPERTKVIAEKITKYSIFRNDYPKGKRFALFKLGEFKYTEIIMNIEA